MELIATLQQKLAQYQQLIAEYTLASNSSKTIFELKKEIAEIIKAINFGSEAEQADLQQQFETTTQQYQQKKTELEKEAEAFAKQVEEQIAVVSKLFEDKKSEKPLEKEDYDELKQFLHNISELTKQPKWNDRATRILAKDKLQQLKDAVKDEESKYYESRREERFQNAVLSLEVTDKVLAVIAQCHPEIAIQETLQICHRFIDYVTPMGLNMEAFTFLNDITEDKQKQVLKIKSEVVRQLRKFVLDSKEVLSPKDKSKIFSSIDELKENLDKSWQEHKADMEKQQQAWAVKKQELDQKRQAWETKQKEFLNMLEEKLEKQKNYEQHLQKIIDDRTEFIKRLENRVVMQSDFKKRLSEQLKDLEDRQASAWTVEFIEKSNKWIEEKQQKLQEIETDIIDIKQKKQDVRHSIAEVVEKQQKAKAGIDEIVNKIEEVKKNLLGNKKATVAEPQPTENPTS